jgi:hypothetical protein
LRGISTHYEEEGKPLPDRVTKSIDDITKQFGRPIADFVGGLEEKCNAVAGAPMGSWLLRRGRRIYEGL